MASRRKSRKLSEDINASVANTTQSNNTFQDNRLSSQAQLKLMSGMSTMQRNAKGGGRKVEMSELPKDVAENYMISSFKKGKFEQPELDEKGQVIQKVTKSSYDGGELFSVSRGDLGTGTDTTKKTRAYVNSPSTYKPSFVEINYLVGSSSFSAPIKQVYSASNPQPTLGYSSGSLYDAGHKLASQNGGRGDVNDWVFPQNPAFNQGNSRNMTSSEKSSTGKTYPVWRAHEQHFHNEVNRVGSGVWWFAQG
ncbi:MAG: hypothetical protein Crog4KO_01150 [Crocinitomicaceae bacterium]